MPAQTCDAYREYLEPRYLDEFDEWAKAYVNPFDDLQGPTSTATSTAAAASRELEADGVVAEVLFPNTIPPFFPSGTSWRRNRRRRSTSGGGPG